MFCSKWANAQPTGTVSASKVKTSIQLQLDIASIQGSEENRRAFVSNFAADIASSLHMSASNVIVTNILPGSIKVEFELIGSSTNDVLDKVTNLAQMVSDPQSALYTGTVTASVDASFAPTIIDISSVDTTLTQSSASSSSGMDETSIIAIAVSCAVGALLIIAGLLIVLYRSKLSTIPTDTPHSGVDIKINAAVDVCGASSTTVTSVDRAYVHQVLLPRDLFNPVIVPCPTYSHETPTGVVEVTEV